MSDYSQSLLGAPEALEAQSRTQEQAGGFLTWLQGTLSSAGQGVTDAIAQTDAYLDAAGYYVANADDLLEASLTLIAILLLHTLVLPLALVAVMIALLRQIARR